MELLCIHLYCRLFFLELYESASAADKFSANTINGGNGLLTYPVALMTADEVKFAGNAGTAPTGGYYYMNSNNAGLLAGHWMWTMSPGNYTLEKGAYIERLISSGSLGPGNSFVSETNPVNSLVRPVLSLKSCVSWLKGDGSANNPYEVVVNNVCKEEGED